MTEAEVGGIESLLGRPLPAEYRVFLMRDAPEVAHADQVLEHRAVLWTDPNEIIQGNLDARRFATEMTIGDDEESQVPWPSEYLVVGTNGGGDYWFLDCSGALTGLWFWQHEAHSVEQDSASLDAYMTDLRAYMKLDPEPWPWQTQ